MLDVQSRQYTGVVNGHPFSCSLDGTLTIGRVSDFVRDEARLQAAGEFLYARRSLRMPRSLRLFWEAVYKKTDLTNFGRP